MWVSDMWYLKGAFLFLLEIISLKSYNNLVAYLFTPFFFLNNGAVLRIAFKLVFTSNYHITIINDMVLIWPQIEFRCFCRILLTSSWFHPTNESIFHTEFTKDEWDLTVDQERGTKEFGTPSRSNNQVKKKHITVTLPSTGQNDEKTRQT